MRNLPDELETALRDGLQAQLIPAVSPDFDTRVLAALQQPRPWWQQLWQPAQPLLAGASFSLIVTLICLHWSLSAPIGTTLAPPQSLTVAGAGGPPVAARPAPSLDALLSRPNLTAGSLATAWNEPPAPTPSASRPPEPHRRAQTFFRRPTLAA